MPIRPWSRRRRTRRAWPGRWSVAANLASRSLTTPEASVVFCSCFLSCSLLHPRVLGRVGIHRRAAVIDRFWAQFVVPGLVAVDLAQPVLSAVLGQPRRGVVGPHVDRVPRHVRKRLSGGHPPGGFLFGSVFRDRLLEQLLLVLRGTPATVDDDLHTGARGISCSLAQGTEEGWIEVGYGWKLVIEDRRVVGDGTVSLAEPTTVLAAKDERTVRLARRTTVLAARDVGG